MKIGDLVRWTNPGHEDVGIAIELWNGHMIIHWMQQPQYSGPYPIDHKYLEVINESR